ncbi:MAG: efflux RND transporter permease subunit [Candidatus Firestonebacteria bacterium]
MNLAGLSIKRPSLIMSLVALMLVIGAICMFRMNVDMMPDVTFPVVVVTTIYPGAGPNEIETQVSKVLEEQIATISGLKTISSTNQDGVSIVVAEFTFETDAKYADQQVRDRIAQVRNKFPTAIQEPIVKRFEFADLPISSFSLAAELKPAELFDLADNTIKSGFSQVDNVGKVEIIGGTKREIHVILDRKKLKDYETSVSAVAGRIAGNSQNIPIGKVSREAKELTFRTIGEFQSVEKIEDVVVNFFGSDVPITVSRLGKVVDTVEEVKTFGYLNGKSSVFINVYKQSGANTVSVSDNLLKRMGKINVELAKQPGSPKLSIIRDNSRGIRLNLKDMKETIFLGILLALVVVYMFLGNFRSTFITILALPNSLIGAFIFMYLFGFTINVLTLMALSLAVGLLLDDAIVVRENIFRHIEKGEPPEEAAQKGTDEVTLAVIATTLTVIAVFLPVGFLQGTVGQFFKQFGLTLVFAMCISLFDALTIAPMLSAYFMGKPKAKEDGKEPSFLYKVIHAPAKWFDVMQNWLERKYESIMKYTLKHKGLVLIVVAVVFVASLGTFMKIPFTFMAAQEYGEFFIDLEAKPGTSLSEMNKYTLEIDELLRKDKDIEFVSATVGNSNGESNVANMFVKMVPAKQRKTTTSGKKVEVRQLLESKKEELNPGVSDQSMNGSKAFNLLLTGNDLDQLSGVAQGLLGKIRQIPGLVDVDCNYKPGKPEFQVKLDPSKMAKFGVQSVSAGMELRGGVEGILPAKYRENGLEYDIRVLTQEDQRDMSKEFNSIYVPNVNMQLVKLKNIAEGSIASGPQKIFKRNRSRYVMITGNLDKGGAIGSITSAARKIMEKEKLPEGVGYQFTGSSEDLKDLVINMGIAAVLSVIFIYLILVSLYESLIIPLTIMSALPLSIVGGLLALFFAGQSLDMFGMIGFIMLLGLSAKNSILLVDFTQKLMRKGLERDASIIEAGKTRLRPILMTTFALIAGMLPLALGLSEVGNFRKSMGVAVIGGLISSTFLTLVVVPAIFGYMDTFRLWTRKILGRPIKRKIDLAEEK